MWPIYGEEIMTGLRKTHAMNHLKTLNEDNNLGLKNREIEELTTSQLYKKIKEIKSNV